MLFRDAEGDSINPWLSHWAEHGASLVVPPVLDAVPAKPLGWSATFDPAGFISVTTGDSVLFEGELQLSDLWREAAAGEGSCCVVVSAIGVVTDELGSQTQEGLNELASRGLVVGATIPIFAQARMFAHN